MSLWIALAFSSALFNSIYQAFSNYVVSSGRFSKATIVFAVYLAGSAVLFLWSAVVGFPQIQSGFWGAIFITAVINAFTAQLFLRAYELGEFSSIYSTILLTPVFSMAVSFFWLGEAPSLNGVAGVLLTVFGLYLISKNHTNTQPDGKNFKKGTFLGISVALLWSVSTVFDKVATLHSNAFFAPAMGTAVVAILSGIYLIFAGKREADGGGLFRNPLNLFLLMSLAVVFAISNVLHNSALAAGFVAYTMAIKRTGVLLGVVWGWLFFRENNFARKFLGAVVAVAGVAAILFA